MNGNDAIAFCEALLHDSGDDAESGEASFRDRIHSAATTISGPPAAPGVVAAIVADLDALRERAHAEMQEAVRAGKNDPHNWRRFYTDASLLRVFALLKVEEDVAGNVALENIAVLDHALVVAGAAGNGRYELITDTIATLQRKCRPPSPPTAATDDSPRANEILISDVALSSSTRTVPIIDPPPSLGRFAREHVYSPFVLRGYARDWPALSEHPWASTSYLRSVAGRGRVVPVEIGHDYRADEWTQAMMPWDDFLKRMKSGEALYLAQHDLFFQFPALQQDIIVPDYVYGAPAPPRDFPAYTPPANAEQLVTNAWFGPGGTVSPAHTVRLHLLSLSPYSPLFGRVRGVLETRCVGEEADPLPQDPFFNFFASLSKSEPSIFVLTLILALSPVQAVGRKTVWLAPPTATPFMYAYPPPSASSEDADASRNPAANTVAPSMSNTTRVDVFADARGDEEEGEFPDFWKHAVPLAMHVTLGPGDALSLPPGWWHATRSEETSFSVSMWY
ncbi:unnamed protein product [Peniophora sp. CBMAI 1063]|nr:unnamed protein product [Peniophora sp. CBMAI 1063]